ncbi:MAG: hypothetical protein PUF31_08850 [Oscillospiraceae bacterium]|nr:hypothetical protein [Oscillospiraceae bacterium]
MESCYTNLANAVILQAAKDYRRALRRLKKTPWDKEAKRRKRECERFFLSDWFKILTSLYGDVLLDDLYREVYGE